MSNRHNSTILIIDDSAAVREIAKDMLQLLDFDVLTATNGEEGVIVFQQNTVDLVLLDMNMPRMDGTATYRALLGIDPNVNVVICSSESKSKIEFRLGDMVMPSYLHKPFDTGVFLDTVQAVLSNPPSLSD